MAIKIQGNTVIDDSRVLSNISSLDSTTNTLINDSVSRIIGSLDKSFVANESATITLSRSDLSTPVVTVTKSVDQTGVLSKGSWEILPDGSNYVIEDTAYPTTLTPSVEWNISDSEFVQTYDIGASPVNEPLSYGVFFKPDGTTLFTIGGVTLGGGLLRWTLSQPWDISTITFDGAKSLLRNSDPTGLFIKPDGSKIYVTDDAQGGNIDEYTLNPVWSSNVAFSNTANVSSEDSEPRGLFFKDDGTKMYMVGRDTRSTYEYNLSSPWELASASYSGVSISIATVEFPYDIFFKSDGTRMYILLSANPDDRIEEYTLSTAWDLSTATASGVTYDVSNEETLPGGFYIDPTGTRLYVQGWSAEAPIYSQLHQYKIPNLGDRKYYLTLGANGTFTSSDVGKKIVSGDAEVVLANATTGRYAPITNFTTFDTPISSGDWSMYSLDVSANGITLPYATYDGWNMSSSTVSYVRNFSVATTAVNPSGVFFKSDGTRMYITSTTNINEYILTTAWNISTASFGNRITTPITATLAGIFFKSDGTKMYVIDSTADAVTEYILDIPWILNSAYYNANFSIAAQELTPTGLFLSSDGTKMYVVGTTGDDVNEYTLSTAWDVSSASYSQNFSIAAQELTPSGLFFKPDGIKMYIIGQTGDDVNEYTLSTAWDVSTAIYEQSFSIASQETFPSGIYIRSDGAKMYVVGTTGDDVNEYDIDVSVAYPALKYITTVTDNTKGAIDTTYWTDVNQMIPDETLNDGSIFYAISTDGRTTWSRLNGTLSPRNIARNNAGTWEYNTNTTYGSETWAAAAINTELDALAQALGVTANRMTGATLKAVGDAYQYDPPHSSNKLNLMIALSAPSGFNIDESAPVANGVFVNYNASALNKGAAPGIDYDFDFPANDKVRITSLKTQDLKIRVV